MSEKKMSKRTTSEILSNERLSKDFCLMRAECPNDARMGQFYMIRAWGSYPVLSRPVSVFDTDGATVSFLYKVVGKGTEIFAALKPGDEITLDGPLGNTFPDLSGNIAMVGGGVGIAPFYLTARELKTRHPDCRVDLYLGFSDQALPVDNYRKVADGVVVDVGGFITDSIEPERYEHIFTCGPEVMMRSLYGKCERAGVADRLYVSMENRMACGVGACFVCSCKTSAGNKKVCKDGPVFRGKEVFGL